MATTKYNKSAVERKYIHNEPLPLEMLGHVSDIYENKQFALHHYTLPTMYLGARGQKVGRYRVKHTSFGGASPTSHIVFVRDQELRTNEYTVDLGNNISIRYSTEKKMIAVSCSTPNIVTLEYGKARLFVEFEMPTWDVNWDTDTSPRVMFVRHMIGAAHARQVPKAVLKAINIVRPQPFATALEAKQFLIEAIDSADRLPNGDIYIGHENEIWSRLSLRGGTYFINRIGRESIFAPLDLLEPVQDREIDLASLNTMSTFL